jgi:DNA polymerase III subunit delta'
MLFQDVIGQQTTAAQLVNLHQQNRLSHALLFLGREGSGALPLAVSFAQYLLCDSVNGKLPASPSLFDSPSLFGDAAMAEEKMEPKAEHNKQACGTCPSCIKAAKLMHPDIHFSYPVIVKKSGTTPVSADWIAEWREFIQVHPYGNVFDWLQFLGADNKQGNISAEECNEIIRKLSLKSFESGFKILLLWLPEYLGKNGNKLLKLIEEPPPQTLFLLVAESEEEILPTIISRTQLVKVPQPSKAAIAEALQQRAGATAEKAAQIAAIAAGNYHEALHLLQHAEDDWQVVLREWLNYIYQRNHAAQQKWIDEMAKQGREKQKQFLHFFNHLLQQSIRLECMGEVAAQQVSPEELDFARRIGKMCGIGQQQAIVEIIDRSSYYIERNANPKMLFHALTIKLYHIIRNNSLILTN